MIKKTGHVDDEATSSTLFLRRCTWGSVQNISVVDNRNEDYRADSSPGRNIHPMKKCGFTNSIEIYRFLSPIILLHCHCLT